MKAGSGNGQEGYYVLRIWTCQLQSYPSSYHPHGICNRCLFLSIQNTCLHVYFYSYGYSRKHMLVLVRGHVRVYANTTNREGQKYSYICIQKGQPHRRSYFPSATPQLRVSRPQNVSSPSLYSQVKLDFIGTVIHSTLPRKVLPAEAITSLSSFPTSAVPPRSECSDKIRIYSDDAPDAVDRYRARIRAANHSFFRSNKKLRVLLSRHFSSVRVPFLLSILRILPRENEEKRRRKRRTVVRMADFYVSVKIFRF